MKAEFLKTNKACWDSIAPAYFGKTALPEYGPLILTEDELGLMGTITGKKVLDIGCGSGHSLEYMANRGATEIWGVDLSSTQIQNAASYLGEKGLDARLFCAPMEEDIDLPRDYFDIVYSIYALGWTCDLQQTLQWIYSYLKQNGVFIFSWDHPLYPCVESREDEVIVERSYFDETVMLEEKRGEPVYIIKRRLSTYINTLAAMGFQIEQLIEGDLSPDLCANCAGKYYTLQKATKVPSSFILKARKK